MGRVNRPSETFFRITTALQLLPLMTLARQRLAGTPRMQAVKRLGTSGWFICSVRLLEVVGCSSQVAPLQQGT